LLKGDGEIKTFQSSEGKMTYVWFAFGWLFALLFGVLTLSMLLLKNWPHALVLFLVVLLCLPPVTSLLHTQVGWSIHPLLRGVLIVGLLFVFVRLLTGAEVTSIYKSPEIKARFLELYDEKMKDWPVPYEDVFVDTQYGVVHVIVSGPEDAPPLLMLASGRLSPVNGSVVFGCCAQSRRACC
jgi:hypothetical protein